MNDENKGEIMEIDEEELAKVQAFVNGYCRNGKATAIRLNSTTFQVFCEECEGKWKIGEHKDGRPGQKYTAAKFIAHLDEEGKCSRSTKMETVEKAELPEDLRPCPVVSANCAIGIFVKNVLIICCCLLF